MTLDEHRPLAVKRAALCLWISAALAFLVTTIQLLGWVSIAGATPGMTASIGLLTAGLLGVVAASISARRGWARWLFTVVYVFGTLAGVVLMVLAPDIFRAMPLVLQANAIVQFILQTAALIFLFSSTSRQWFATRHAKAAP